MRVYIMPARWIMCNLALGVLLLMLLLVAAQQYTGAPYLIDRAPMQLFQIYHSIYLD